MTVLTLSGKAINWAKPPKATDKVMWSHRTTGGKKVIGSFRTICHLEHMSILSKKKFNGQGIVVIQGPFNTGVAASAGTHDRDACLDVFIPGVPWSEQQSFLRANGAGAYWRKPPAFGNHIHYLCLPPREGHSISDDYRVHGFTVGKYVDGGWSTAGREFTSSQIADYYNHRTALAGHARDSSWHPTNIEATIFDLPAFIKKQRGDVVPLVKPTPKPSTSVPTHRMTWKGKTLSVDSPIFKTPPKQHHWAPAVGDRIKGAWEHVKAGEAVDGNLTPGAGHIWFLHWGNAGKDGYHNVVKNGHVVPMTKAELNRSLDAWGYEGIKSWRDKHGQAPMTLAEGLTYAIRHHFYVAMEVKGPAWAHNVRWFQLLRAVCARLGHPAVVKRIATLNFPKETVANAHKAKVKVAAIYGSKVKGRSNRVARTLRFIRSGAKFDATW